MIDLIKKAIGIVDNRFFEGIALFLARLALAAQFWRSARTKVEEGSFLQMRDITVDLFRDEYGMPFPEITGLIATYAEHIFPILLVLGLFTRFSAAALFVMTLVIQLFVYPEAWWNPHIMWFALALILIARGGGLFALDRLGDRTFGKAD
ncbi:DoxX family protein [Sphingorhabdus sp. Alg239-R122]|uniref:DoxX family protein n=1 Tax=Sphingorhabdus sp. Alg239-R122 TaxID=2305989 RepID=UPI0013DD7780|nr:DoxX family protein [Sphingorhabdus sp. Alg239-R122]